MRGGTGTCRYLRLRDRQKLPGVSEDIFMLWNKQVWYGQILKFQVSMAAPKSEPRGGLPAG